MLLFPHFSSKHVLVADYVSPESLLLLSFLPFLLKCVNVAKFVSPESLFLLSFLPLLLKCVHVAKFVSLEWSVLPSFLFRQNIYVLNQYNEFSILVFFKAHDIFPCSIMD